jgi:hypothetical protein
MSKFSCAHVYLKFRCWKRYETDDDGVVFCFFKRTNESDQCRDSAGKVKVKSALKQFTKNEKMKKRFVGFSSSPSHAAKKSGLVTFMCALTCCCRLLSFFFFSFPPVLNMFK